MSKLEITNAISHINRDLKLEENLSTELQNVTDGDGDEKYTYAGAIKLIVKLSDKNKGIKAEEMEARLRLWKKLDESTVDGQIEFGVKETEEIRAAVKAHGWPDASEDVIKFSKDLGVL